MNNARNTFDIALIVTWLCFTVFAFFYVSSKSLVKFDPNHRLSKLSHGSFIKAIQQDGRVGNRTVVHFYQPECNCAIASKAHRASLSSLAENNGYAVTHIDAQDTSVVPSTPSVAIIDDNDVLIYFGPYGAGLMCSQTNGYALTVFQNHLKGFDANLIASDTQGCFCNT